MQASFLWLCPSRAGDPMHSKTLAPHKASPVLGALTAARTPALSLICGNTGKPFLQKAHSFLPLPYIQLPVSQNC